MPETAQENIAVLPDGSAFFGASFPLPSDHWLYVDEDDKPIPILTIISELVLLSQ